MGELWDGGETGVPCAAGDANLSPAHTKAPAATKIKTWFWRFRITYGEEFFRGAIQIPRAAYSSCFQVICIPIFADST
jgi:hypothetical protein